MFDALRPPPIPSWDGLHPLVVHFPVALLLVAPLFVLLGLMPRIGGRFAWAALVLLVLGTVGAYVAVESGEAAARLAQRTDVVTELIEQHEELAEAVRTFYTIMTLVYAAVLIVPVVLKKRLPRFVPIVAGVLVFIALAIGNLMVANTGHLGGLLVHREGVQAWLE